jgi:hypothetical protein
MCGDQQIDATNKTMSDKSRSAKLVGSCDARRDKMLLLESECCNRRRALTQAKGATNGSG